MIQALKQAFSDVFRSNIRGLLWGTIFLTVLIFGILLFGFSELLSAWQMTDIPWLARLINVLGYFLFFLMALFMFPAAATFVAGFFIDSVVERLAAKAGKVHLRAVPLSESLKMSGVVALKGVLLSGLLMPLITLLGFVPLLNLVPPALFYILNGRLFGQEYFYAVAARYLDFPEAKALFEKDKAFWRRAGVIIAFLMTVPVVNMISPLVAVAFMRNLFLSRQSRELEK